MNHLRKLLVATLIAVLAAPAAAVAWPGHGGFDWTYPNAARLCSQVAAGHPPKRLAASSTQVSAACTQLRTSLTAAQTAYTTATTPLRRQALAAIRQYVQICRQDRLNHDARACRPAREAAITTLGTLRLQVSPAARAYRQAVNSARQTFWATIRSLRGGTAVTADSVSVPAPTSPVPANSAVPPA